MSQIKVRNKQTGEVKVIDSSQLQNGQTQVEEPQKKGRLLGGAIPIAGSILGGIGGGLLGGPTIVGAPLAAIGGATAGYGAGYGMEQSLENLLGRQQEQPLQQLAQGGGETAMAGVSELLGGPLGTLGNKLFGSLAKYLPANLIKVALREPGKQLEKTVVKQAEQQLLKEGTERPARELAEGIADRNMVGTARNLTSRAVKQLSGLPGTVEANLQKLIGKLPGKPDLQSILLNAAQRVDETFPSAEAGTKLLDLANDIGSKYKSFGWDTLLQLRRSLDKIGKGKIAEESPALVTQYRLALADEMRKVLREAGGDDIAKMFDELQFNLLLRNAGAKAASKPLFSRGDIIPLLIGGGIGASTGSLPLAMSSVAAAKAPFMTGTATAGAYGVKKLMELLGGASQVLPRVGAQIGGRSALEQLINPQNNEQP